MHCCMAAGQVRAAGHTGCECPRAWLDLVWDQISLGDEADPKNDPKDASRIAQPREVGPLTLGKGSPLVGCLDASGVILRRVS